MEGEGAGQNPALNLYHRNPPERRFRWLCEDPPLEEGGGKKMTNYAVSRRSGRRWKTDEI